MSLPDWAQGPKHDSNYQLGYNPHDYDAQYGVLDDETIIRESRRNNRTLALAGVGVVAVGAFVGGAIIISANQQGNSPRAEASAGPFVPSSSPSASETSASPSPSKTSASPSPSESKTSAAPSPSEDPASPTNIPSPSRSTHKVELPPIETTPAAPETHTSAPESCVWPNNGGVVTVAECGDHTAYNDPNLSGEHQLGVGMQFEGACALNGMIRISYGGSFDYVENHGYFSVAPSC